MYIIHQDSLLFHANFKDSLDEIPFHLYPNIRTIIFPHTYNRSLDDVTCVLPNITKITFDWNFNQPIDNIYKIFPNLTHLGLHSKFNQPLTNISKLTKLVVLYLYGEFDKPITELPPSLKYLRLSNMYDKYIPHCPTLTYLRVGECYNKVINLSNFPNLKTFIYDSKKSFIVNDPIVFHQLSHLQSSYTNKYVLSITYYLTTVNTSCYDYKYPSCIKDRCKINLYNQQRRRSGLFDSLL